MYAVASSLKKLYFSFSTQPFILIMIEMLFIDSSLLNLSASTAIDRIDSPETALLLQRFSLRGPKNCGHNWTEPIL